MSIEPPHEDGTIAFRQLLERLPAVLAFPLHEYVIERHPILRLHRLCDAVEVITRFCTIAALAELRGYLAGQELPIDLVNVLRESLALPSFGRWRGILENVLRNIPRSAPVVAPSLIDYGRLKLLPFIAASGSKPPEVSLLALRNILAHGGPMATKRAQYYLSGDVGPPSNGSFSGWESRCSELFAALDAIADCEVGFHQTGRFWSLRGFASAQESVELPADVRLAIKHLNDHVLLINEGRWRDLWPLCDYGRANMLTYRGIETARKASPMLYFRAEPARLLYAALGAELPYGERTDVVADFRKLFQLDRPKDMDISFSGYEHEFAADAEEFVGRTSELERAKEAVLRTESGVLWISGDPGIGKSCLVARVARDCSEDFPAWCHIAWRFKASDTTRCHRFAFFQYAIRRLATWLQRTDVLPEREFHKLEAQFFDLLTFAMRATASSSDALRILLILDGVDEIARTDPSFLRIPFQRADPGVIWLCAGRADPAVQAVFTLDVCTPVYPDGVPPMSANDIRAMMLLGVERLKYELLRLDQAPTVDAEPTNAAVEAVVQRAAGLPLFVRLAIEDVRTLRLRFEDFATELPRSLQAYYDDLLTRLGAEDVQAVLPFLVATVVVAKEPLDLGALYLLLVRRTVVEETAEGLDTVRRGLDMVRSLVRPTNPLGDQIQSYEPIHPSFRDYILRHAQRKLSQQTRLAHDHLIKTGREWMQLPLGHSARHYALRHRAEHLADLCLAQDNVIEERRNQSRAELYALARDGTFFLAQQEELTHAPQLPLASVLLALEVASQVDDATAMAEFVLLHAFRVKQIGQQSPLNALRGGDLERAWKLADLSDPECRIVWHLLLEWELQSNDRLLDAERTRKRLLAVVTPRLSGSLAKMAVVVAARVMDDKCEETPGIAGSVFQGDYLYSLAEEAAKASRFRLARTMACGIEGGWQRARALRTIAAAQIAAGDIAGALETAGGIEDSWHLAAALREIAVAQATAGEIADARETLARASETACRIEVEERRAEVQRDIAAAHAAAGKIAEARENFARALEAARGIKDERQRDHALREIAAAQAAARDFMGALKTAQEIAGQYDRSEAVIGIIAAQAGSGNIVEALETACGIENGWYLGKALRTIAAAQVAAGNVAGALDTAGGIENGWFLVEVLGEIAVAQAVTGEIVDARETFTRALEAARGIDDQRQRVRALWKIAADQADAGEVADARATFTPTLVNALEWAHEIDDDRYEDLREIVVAQTAARDFMGALKTAQEIAGQYDCAEAILGVIAAQASSGNIVEALKTAGGIEDGWRRAEALRTIAAAQVAAGNVAGALETAGGIEDNWHLAVALLGIAVAQAAAADIADARETFTRASETACRIEDEERRAEVQRDIAAAQIAAGDIAGTRETLARTLQTHRRIAYEWERGWALREIAAAQAAAGDVGGARESFTRASETVRGIKWEWERAWALREIASTQAAAGDLSGARDGFARALLIACCIRDEEEHESAVLSIATAQAAAGDLAGARETTRWASHWSYPELQRVVAAQATAGDLEGARKTLRKIDEKEQGGGLLGIVAAQAAAGDLEGARETLRGIEDSRYQAKAMRKIAAAQAAAGDVGGARESFTRASETVRGIKWEWERAWALCEIASTQAAAGDLSGARETFTRALDTACGIEDEERRAEAQRRIAAAQAEAGDIMDAFETFTHASETARGRKHVGRLTKVQQDIAASQATAQAAVGDVDGALETARQIDDEKELAQCFKNIGVELVKRGLAQQAYEVTTKILVNRPSHLTAIAETMVMQGDRLHFKQLLPACALYIDSAYRVCGMLASLYPHVAGDIARLFSHATAQDTP